MGQNIFGLFVLLLTFILVKPTQALLLLLSPQDAMQEVSADSRVPAPAIEHFAGSQFKGGHLNSGFLEEFAQNMTDIIIQSFLRQKVGPEMSKFNQDQEMLAEELASAVIKVALEEVCRGPNVEDHSEGFYSSRSGGAQTDGAQAIDQSGRKRDFLDVDTEMDRGQKNPTFKDPQPSHPPLSQSGLPIMGSLDYPDAPPTTPLLPELERSRHSFARKLKGGLANAFLPSPPPPTPKDKVDDSASAAVDPRAELMEHLMHSLPTEDLAGEVHHEVGPHRGAKMEAFAESLSSEIVNWVRRSREQIADDTDIHKLAHRLADTIICSSLDEARMLV